MLVLSRKKEERIIVGGGDYPVIVLTVVQIRGDKVRIGIDAPKDMPVHRSEVYDAIKRNEAGQVKSLAADNDQAAAAEASVSPPSSD